ncbi:MAG: TIGR00282 family metallophosphoesterase [Candidatus Omnitrophica bacterium]|nr:TIGR00282 family metallophosphoesterase [Candidatus Omnitrophota bacterium]MCF7879019.1 TIGR00282 family metallophosphoesterase [Candidatus Omnitrophota bacterium]
MKILFLGDIVGKPARNFLSKALPRLKEETAADLVIANGENAAGGSSITPDTARDIFTAGVDILTSGDHIFKKKIAKNVLENSPLIRPLNYGSLAAGSGYIVKEVKGVKVAVVNLLGRVFMHPVDCPFKAIKKILPDLKNKAKIIIVDMHAEATSEKVAMGYFLAEEVSAVLGTHTHIPTADQRIINGFTAYVTDLGMTGSFDSVLGRQKEAIIERFFTNMPVRFDLAKGDLRIQGVVLDIEEESGKALAIERVEYKKS